MNILFLTEFLTAVGGGGEVVFAEYAREMGRRGHSVHIVCHESVIDSSPLIKSANVNVYRIGPEMNLRHGYFPSLSQQLFYILRLLIECSRIIELNNIDVIHANTLSPSVAGSILGLLYDIPIITTFHHVGAVQDGKYRSGNSKGVRVKLFAPLRLRQLSRLLAEKIILYLPLDCVHAVSQATASDLRRFGFKGTIVVVPNGFDLTRYEKAQVFQEYRPRVLFVGRLVQSKNLEVVIEAFAKTSEALPRAKLIIAGDGPMRSKWEKQANDLGISSKVQFVGYVSEETKLDLIKKCSALVFPSIIEGFGLTILESFAMNKPILVSDIEPLNELVSDGVDGFVISPTDSHEWEKRMKQVLSSESLCREMGTAGRSKLEREYQIEKAGELLEAMYSRSTSKRRMTINNERQF